MTNIFDFSRGAQLREERLPGARRLALLTERLEGERAAALAAAATKKEAEKKFERSIPAAEMQELLKASGWTGRAITNATGVPSILGGRTWRTSLASWHKGPPPHVGKWTIGTQPGVNESVNLWDGVDWRTLRGTWHDEPDYYGIKEMLWFGHAPDADGWIQWEGGECPVPPGMRRQLWLRGDGAVGSGVVAAEQGLLRWHHTGEGGDIVAYRVSLC